MNCCLRQPVVHKSSGLRKRYGMVAYWQRSAGSNTFVTSQWRTEGDLRRSYDAQPGTHLPIELERRCNGSVSFIRSRVSTRLEELIMRIPRTSEFSEVYGEE